MSNQKKTDTTVICIDSAPEGFTAIMRALAIVKSVQAGVVTGRIPEYREAMVPRECSEAMVLRGYLTAACGALGAIAGMLDDVCIAADGARDYVELREYRLTRGGQYDHECIGRIDVGARQGYYVFATSPVEAANKLRERFPGERFDVQTKHDLLMVLLGA